MEVATGLDGPVLDIARPHREDLRAERIARDVPRLDGQGEGFRSRLRLLSL